ncbi:antibiotic biosynthesis monooxygenase family protein [Cryptosporangium arvum]|uniref:antibiotic biosynthesis monooxygenase family protein n=1 Tax=Cryptosporangium arvum TaxID=80871 RepID=UPI001B80D3DC|nr:antibiotic biosynthesis monooxygenase [Cryptosporangium arvum]
MAFGGDALLVISRFDVPEADGEGFLERARAALAAFAARPGFVRGRIGRSADVPTAWALTTEWESVGSFRRALSDFDVKVHASTLLAESSDEPSAFEVMGSWDGPVETAGRTDRALDADTTRVGDRPVTRG